MKKSNENKKFSHQRGMGFTLVELLITIAIIGILASVILVSLSNGRKKARDARRRSDVNQIAKALQVYYLEYGTLPQPSQYGQGGAGGWDTSVEGGDFMQFLEGTPAGYSAVNPRNIKFFSNVPSDPKNDACNSFFNDVCAQTGSPKYAYRYYYYTPVQCAAPIPTGGCTCKGKVGANFNIAYRSEVNNSIVVYCQHTSF